MGILTQPIDMAKMACQQWLLAYAQGPSDEADIALEGVLIDQGYIPKEEVVRSFNVTRVTDWDYLNNCHASTRTNVVVTLESGVVITFPAD